MTEPTPAGTPSGRRPATTSRPAESQSVAAGAPAATALPNGPFRVLAVVPAYNEEASIANVVAELRAVAEQGGDDENPATIRHAALPAFQLDVLVINDCSQDATAEVLRSLRCPHLNLPVNLGIGGAMQTGFRYALAHHYDAAVQVDGDGQHPAAELPALLAPLRSGDADVVIGSRYLSTRSFRSTAARRVGIRFFSTLNRLLIGQRIRDSTSGLRALNRRALEVAARHYPDEYPEPEAIVLFGLHGLRLREVPVTMRERQGGTSSIRAFRSLYYMVKVTLSVLTTYLRFRYGKRRSV